MPVWPRSLPKPPANLNRYRGVFAPNSAHRARVTKAGRGKGASAQAAPETDRNSPACGGAMRILACIEDPVVIDKILAHLDAKAVAAQTARPPPCRGPPERRSSGALAGAVQLP